MARSGTTKKPNQNRRNERERNRVNQLNENLEILRNHVPIAKATKKLNKAQTLREAAKYIEHLQALLNANYGDQQGQNYASCDQQAMMPHHGGFAYSDFDIYFPSQNSSQVSMSMEHSPTSSHSSMNMGTGQISPAHQMSSQALSPVSEPAMYHHQNYQMQHYQVMHHSP